MYEVLLLLYFGGEGEERGRERDICTKILYKSKKNFLLSFFEFEIFIWSFTRLNE